MINNSNSCFWRENCAELRFKNRKVPISFRGIGEKRF